MNDDPSKQPKPRSSRSRRRREEKKRARELRRIVLATAFVALEATGFCLANLSEKDSWNELIGFLLLQPVQILLNLLDGRFQLTRGMRDTDAVLLVTLIALPLNVFLGYWVWRGWRKLRRTLRRRRHAVGSAYGPAPLPQPGNSRRGSSGSRPTRVITTIETEATADTGQPLRK